MKCEKCGEKGARAVTSVLDESVTLCEKCRTQMFEISDTLLERERLEKKRIENERIIQKELFKKEQSEKGRLKRKRLEQDKVYEQGREYRERFNKDLAVRQRIEQERLEKKQALERKRLEEERIERERITEEQRLEKEQRLEQERIEKEERERIKEKVRAELEPIKEEIRLKKLEAEVRQEVIEELDLSDFLSSKGLSQERAESEYAENGEVNRYIPLKVRREVWRRDRGKCVECGTNRELEYDHIIPISKHGSNTVRNIQLLCGDCNREKSDNI